MSKNSLNCRRVASPSDGEEQGYIMVAAAFLLVAMLGLAALSVDLGKASEFNRKLQYASDAAALSGVRAVQEGNTDNAEVEGLVDDAIDSNGLDSTGVELALCGEWDKVTKTFTSCDGNCTGADCTCSDFCADSAANAVKVVARDSSSSIFANVFGIGEVSPIVESIAYVDVSGEPNCIRPFGVAFQNLNAIEVGDYFTVGRNSAGNWGKLDIGGNMSSGSNFEDAMLSNVCNNEVQIGEPVSPGTGFGGPIGNVFDQVAEQEKNYNMIIPVVTTFPSGNSGTVEILEFIEVNFHYHNNRNGNNWQATFELVARNVAPDTTGIGASAGSGERVLVK